MSGTIWCLKKNQTILVKGSFEAMQKLANTKQFKHSGCELVSLGLANCLLKGGKINV